MNILIYMVVEKGIGLSETGGIYKAQCVNVLVLTWLAG